ncbi:XrtA/PEP-CTERM system exopolysaccharide export protein [Alkalilimnicola sp. S0819]|uniref:XrtA/PEP-CTERM system exopolysaccharide export protein n=1 Tax=Alkalilimnicola sp. S0819 TaxID=2613922 RepID=UPI0012619E60|nr:XrtA/PEP-CTERM system exopolysaccharide export protein [Alkalilimnicola sp. S0819]KAB7622841.1 sugar ABC transporter substrate-binding protein [Alkalilimnicola sp. S0819]MPQ17163.1 sugar ABC transporter substrate-binding protein [Alkalilimnicola sp. S0819]
MMRLSWIIGLAGLLLAAGCVQRSELRQGHAPQAWADERPASEHVSPKAYRIGTDDQLQVNVWRNPDLSVDAPVRPDGKITLPLIGDVQAAGRTPESVSQAVEEALKQYLKAPRVAVIVTEMRSHDYAARVRVTGAVTAPISLPHRPGMTVLDAILEAGGLNEFAAANRARLYRREGDASSARVIRLGDIIERGDLGTNVALQPGDVISVPERLF